MNRLSRRNFLVLIGTGVVAAAAGGVALTIHQLAQAGKGGSVTFQAVAALPRRPLPGYASYVVAGQVNLVSRTGAITRTVFAGPPDEMQPVALLSKAVRVTDVKDQGSSLSITGVVDQHAGLQQGETSSFQITFDASHQTAQGDFFGSPIELQVEQWKQS